MNQGSRLLVVDDDPDVLGLVRRALASEGYEITTATSVTDAIARTRQGLPHLAIVDLMLPDGSGFDVCQHLKALADVPIVLLTALDDEDTKVQGIERFAEDYITKPFSPKELRVRVRRVLGRFGLQPDFARADVTIDEHLRVSFVDRWAEIDGQRVSLSPTEAKLLYVLVRNQGRVVTTETLLNRCWDVGEEAFPEGLRVHMRRLRQKIEPDPSEPRYLVTERGIGYRFTLPA